MFMRKVLERIDGPPTAAYSPLSPKSTLIEISISHHPLEDALVDCSLLTSTCEASAGAPVMVKKGEDPPRGTLHEKTNTTFSAAASTPITSYRQSFCAAFLAWDEILCWFPVIICMLFSMPGGSMHCFGNITIYIASYLRIYTDETICYSDVQWIYAIQAITQGLAVPLGSKLENYIGVRFAALVSGWTLSLSLISSYFASSYKLLLLTYGVLFGIGSGMVYVLPLSVALKWRPKHKGLVTGLIFIARGMSVSFLSPWQTWYVNPLNKAPTYFPYNSNEQYYVEESILNNVPYVFLWMGIGFAILQLFCAVFMHNPKQVCRALRILNVAYREMGFDAYDVRKTRASTDLHFTEKNNSRSSQNRQVATKIPRMSIFQILTYPQFWVMWLIMCCNWQSICFVNGYWKVIGQVEFGLADAMLAYLGGIVAVFNSISRLIWGYAMDFYGFKVTMTIFCFGFSGFLLAIPICKQLSPSVMVVSYHFVLYFLKILDAGAFTIVAPEVSNIFGDYNFSAVFGLLYTARAIGTVVCACIVASLYGRIGGVGVCVAMAIFTLLAGFINLSGILKPLPSIAECSDVKYSSRKEGTA
ncbi:transporter, major facilitator family protein [Cardiosporidium cionae]|uniref:Transporter, major facilitator family protein n=1 Tax=Cardiosporidium cionae TaxID=476202 RepID=A0ABQ7JA48_9APIC|nr:transporter, major facilitator family protein [Cardiosporidium cionae]|eukprot:KAF8820883.1 transporter, major facilitator family protein [Cardiosporidium cionae]